MESTGPGKTDEFGQVDILSNRSTEYPVCAQSVAAKGSYNSIGCNWNPGGNDHPDSHHADGCSSVLNLCIALIILLVSMYTREALEFQFSFSVAYNYAFQTRA